MASRAQSTDNDILRGIPAARIKLIERIAAEARQRVAGTALDLRRRFLRAYYRGVGEEDLSQRAPADLANMALRHLETGYQRPGGRPLVEVFNLFDRENFGIPVRILESPAFGKSTYTTTPPRTVQLAARFFF